VHRGHKSIQTTLSHDAFLLPENDQKMADVMERCGEGSSSPVSASADTFKRLIGTKPSQALQVSAASDLRLVDGVDVGVPYDTLPIVLVGHLYRVDIKGIAKRAEVSPLNDITPGVTPDLVALPSCNPVATNERHPVLNSGNRDGHGGISDLNKKEVSRRQVPGTVVTGVLGVFSHPGNVLIVRLQE